MADTVQIDIVSAEESIFSGNAEFIVAPAKMGEVGIYPHHAPMITTLKSGSVRIKLAEKNEEQLIYVSGGILEVQPGHVTVLSDTAIRGSDLDEAKAQSAKKAAEEAMKNKGAEIDFAKAQAELAEAMAQLQAIEKLRKKK
jgi:F-type H+-transporting ATPase subunit epsilon